MTPPAMSIGSFRVVPKPLSPRLKVAVGVIVGGMFLATAAPAQDAAPAPGRSPGKPIRVATFNVSLYGREAGQIQRRLLDGTDRQAKQLAAIVQTIRPDILLVNEIDHEPDGATARLLNDQYFAVATAGREAITYDHVLSFPSNTGVASGKDINGDGQSQGPDDAWGYGVYPGQYAMAIYSRYPIDRDNLRTFQHFRWSRLPGAMRPMREPQDDVTTPAAAYHPDDVWESLRLSSKNHIDLPIVIGGHTLHVLGSHPTPPVFDGPEDRNGKRNHDEIAFWTRYLGGDRTVQRSAAAGDEDPSDDRWPVDDAGRAGGLDADASFVILGDLNADPQYGDGIREGIANLLSHPRVTDPRPRGVGVAGDGKPGSAVNPLATSDFGRNGLMRVDYALPSSNLKVVDSGVFWPQSSDDDHDLIKASDHRLVWVDVTLP